MKPSPFLRCPNGCKTVERDFKLVRWYGPHRTPLHRCLKCGREFSGRYRSVLAGFHTDEQTIYRVLKALAEGGRGAGGWGLEAGARPSPVPSPQPLAPSWMNSGPLSKKGSASVSPGKTGG